MKPDWQMIGLFTLPLLLLVFMAINKIPTPYNPAKPNSQNSSGQTLGAETKFSGCIINNGLPDSSCTPGAVFPDATRDSLCRLTLPQKDPDISRNAQEQLFKKYDFRPGPLTSYQVDRLVSLNLGGTNDPANLWPQTADPKPGFAEKDQVENYLHDQVCSGKLSLTEAQKQITTDWTRLYDSIK